MGVWEGMGSANAGVVPPTQRGALVQQASGLCSENCFWGIKRGRSFGRATLSCRSPFLAAGSNSPSFYPVSLLFSVDVCVLRESESTRAPTWELGRLRRERIPGTLFVVSAEPDVGLELTNRKILT